jgi:apolipoprotein N-acyltransferase
MKSTIQQFWNSRWMLSILSGILLGLSFPPFPFPFLQFPAFIFIFQLMSLCRSAKEAAYFVYPGFLIWNIVVSYWLMMASVAAGTAAILANAVLMALTVMLQFKAQEKFSSGWIIALLQTAFWVSFEYLHHQWDLSWPWLSLGNGWSDATAVIQYISATGFLGISFWVMLGSALSWQAIRQRKKNLKISAACILLLFPIISVIQGSFMNPQSDTSVETVVAQPNFDSYEDLGGFDSPRQTLDLLLRLSDSVRTQNTQLIVWPENGIHPYITNRNKPGSFTDRIKNRLKDRAADWNTTIIGGTPFIEYYVKDDHPPMPRQEGENLFLTFNAATSFYPDSTMQVYRKHNLVTIVERFPFAHFFNAVDVFGLIDWPDIQGFGQGNKPDQFRAGSTLTPALICYDSVYPGWIRTFVQNGAGFITVITNDGWWGDSSGHTQHFAYARLRAVEFRRWVVRSANNGISGVIGPDGSIKKETDYWTRTAFRYNVPVLTAQTFYARHGDWLPIGLLVISVGGIVMLFVRREK